MVKSPGSDVHGDVNAREKRRGDKEWTIQRQKQHWARDIEQRQQSSDQKIKGKDQSVEKLF